MWQIKGKYIHNCKMFVFNFLLKINDELFYYYFLQHVL
jgi:hypothetical protein